MSGTAFQAPQNILDLLQRLHKRSLDQEAELKAPNGGYSQIREKSKEDAAAGYSLREKIMEDKFIALAEDKASFLYNLIRATGALNIVEAGTSYGVSTIYLALGVRQNAAVVNKKPGEAKVIATEYEPAKAEQARKNWQEAGEAILPWIELRDGDILKTLQKDVPTVDLVLFDIWTPMALPTLKLLESRFRPGTVLIVDNPISAKEGYAEFYSYVNAGPYNSLTLPFEDGLGMVVYSPKT